MKRLSALFIMIGLAIPAAGADAPEVKISGTFEPAEAKPGQTVSLKIKVEFDKSYHTYPTVQIDPAAAMQVNKITYPEKGSLVFVEKTVEPSNPKVVAEPTLGITKMHEYEGGGTWERKVVVAPNAAAGALKTKVKFRILICDEKGCLPPKTLEIEPEIKVAGQAVPVDSKFKDLVEKAMKR